MSFARKYVVIKWPQQASAPAAKPSLAGALQSRTIRLDDADPDGPGRAAATVSSVDMTDKEADDLKHDRSVLVAPAMSLKLIAPVASVAPAGAKASTSKRPPWGLTMVGATRPNQMTGQGVTVAVLDTGIQREHEAFTRFDEHTLIEQNFTTSGNGGDEHGHGTHCAGTIFGGPVNGRRIGVAPGVDRVLIGKVLGPGATSGSLANAIYWALSKNADVISMSLGIDFPGYAAQLQQLGMNPAMAMSKALEGYRDNLRLFDTLALAVRHGGAFGKASVLIAATGNESDRRAVPGYTVAVSPPAVGDGIVAVGAIDKNSDIAYFSNTGPTLVAPGVDILSADIKGGLTTLSGTSMATPHVAGVAALWFESLRKAGTPISPKAVTDRLIRSAKSLKLSETDVGQGLVQAPP